MDLKPISVLLLDLLEIAVIEVDKRLGWRVQYVCSVLLLQNAWYQCSSKLQWVNLVNLGVEGRNALCIFDLCAVSVNQMLAFLKHSVSPTR